MSMDLKFMSSRCTLCLTKNHKASEEAHEAKTNLTEQFALERVLLSHGEISI